MWYLSKNKELYLLYSILDFTLYSISRWLTRICPEPSWDWDWREREMALRKHLGFGYSHCQFTSFLSCFFSFIEIKAHKRLLFHKLIEMKVKNRELFRTLQLSSWFLWRFKLQGDVWKKRKANCIVLYCIANCELNEIYIVIYIVS